MILNFRKYINEACDTIYPYSNNLDDEVRFDDENYITYPFIYFHGKSDKTYMTLGDNYGMHAGMTKPADVHEDVSEVCRGRAFVSQKIITFWNYPEEKSDFYKIVKHLEVLLGDSLSDWKVEIVNVKGDAFDPYDPVNYDYISIHKYNGSEKQSEVARLNHEESPLNKRQNAVDKVKGWKPKKFKYKTPGELDITAKRRLKNIYQEKLKMFENFEKVDTIEKYIFFVDSVRQSLLIVDDEEELTYKLDTDGEYQHIGDLTIDEYVTEKILNNKCDFYCDTCWEEHNGDIIDVEVYDPGMVDEAGGPWVRVKFKDCDGVIFESDDDDWHSIEPYSQVTVYSEQSELSKEHEEFLDELENIKKYNL